MSRNMLVVSQIVRSLTKLYKDFLHVSHVFQTQHLVFIPQFHISFPQRFVVGIVSKGYPVWVNASLNKSSRRRWDLFSLTWSLKFNSQRNKGFHRLQRLGLVPLWK